MNPLRPTVPISVSTSLLLLFAGCSSNPGPTANDMAQTSSGSCAPTAGCDAVDKTCLGLVNNTGQTKFGLRMSELEFSRPMALASGAVATVTAGAVTPNDPSCNLSGTATLSWLLQFDTTAGTLTTGGARPVASAAAGYTFDNETITSGATSIQVAPITAMARPDSGGNFSTAGQKLYLPLFLDAAGTNVVLFPLQQLRFTMGTLSASQNCIGSYNAAGLLPANSCQPDPSATPPATLFIPGGALTAFIALADADNIAISQDSASLCVVLAGSMYSDGAQPIAHCKKDMNGNFVFQGDWCAATNAAATPTCADSVQVDAQFAASSILITG